jgi:hypothetical protein
VVDVVAVTTSSGEVNCGMVVSSIITSVVVGVRGVWIVVFVVREVMPHANGSAMFSCDGIVLLPSLFQKSSSSKENAGIVSDTCGGTGSVPPKAPAITVLVLLVGGGVGTVVLVLTVSFVITAFVWVVGSIIE